MESSVSPKDETWFLRVCHHISNAVYVTFEISYLTLIFKTKTIEKVVLSKWNCVWQLTFTLSVKYCLYCTLTVTNMAMMRKPSCSLLYLKQSEPVCHTQKWITVSPLRTMHPIYRTGVPLPSRCCILYIFFQQM